MGPRPGRLSARESADRVAAELVMTGTGARTRASLLIGIQPAEVCWNPE